MNDYDRYNPYSKTNKYSFARIKESNQQIIDFLIEDFINIDISKDEYMNVYSNSVFKDIIANIIYETMVERSIEFFDQFYFKMSINEKNVKSMMLGSCFLPLVCGELIKNQYVIHVAISHFYDCRRRKKIRIVPFL